MRIGQSLTSITVLLAMLAAAAPVAVAQTARAWVDPPAEIEVQTQTQQLQAPKPQDETPVASPLQAGTPAPAPTQSAQPQASAPEAPAPQAPAATPPVPAVAAQTPRDPEADQRRARAAVAKDFVIDYLESWSASNDIALESTAAFYAPRVLFHGREVSMQRLFNEKRRFVSRWPERDYRPRQDAIGTACNPPGEICTVHAVFDFTTSHPKRRRVSKGTGTLQLIVHFIGDKPIIVAEHSTLLGQERKRNLALEGATHD
jgi:hypothetical protein